MGSPVSLLIARAARGDLAATAELARTFHPSIRRYVHSRLGGALRRRVDTDDVCQSALHAILCSLSTFRFEGEGQLMSWLNTIAEQKVRNAARHHRAQRRDPLRERPLDQAEKMKQEGTSPTQHAVREEVIRSVHEAIEGLPELQRQVVRLHSFEGKSFREIAETLKLADKSSARRLFLAALARIGQLMDGA